MHQQKEGLQRLSPREMQGMFCSSTRFGNYSMYVGAIYKNQITDLTSISTRRESCDHVN